MKGSSDMIQVKPIEGGTAHLFHTAGNGSSVLVLVKGEKPDSHWFADSKEADEFFASLEEVNVE